MSESVPPPPEARSRRPALTLALFVLADVLCVLVFAAAGRGAHDSDSSFLVVLRIAWPYLVGLAVAWLVVTGRGMRPLRLWPGGVFCWITTYVVGMALRGLSGRGLDPAFLIVSFLFLGLTMVGWRFVVIAKRRYRR